MYAAVFGRSELLLHDNFHALMTVLLKCIAHVKRECDDNTNDSGHPEGIMVIRIWLKNGELSYNYRDRKETLDLET